MDAVVSVVLHAIDQAYDTQSWHGTNLRGSLRGLNVETAVWRPGVGRHNIWEIVVHAAYWKYTARRRLLSQKRGSFAWKGSNWFERPVRGIPPEKAWKSDLALLDAEHERLREAVRSLSAADLSVVPTGSKHTTEFLLTGIAAHDLYHAGQIQLLKRLAHGRRRR